MPSHLDPFFGAFGSCLLFGRTRFWRKPQDAAAPRSLLLDVLAATLAAALAAALVVFVTTALAAALAAASAAARLIWILC